MITESDYLMIVFSGWIRAAPQQICRDHAFGDAKMT